MHNIMGQILILDALSELGKFYRDFFKINYIFSQSHLHSPSRNLGTLDHGMNTYMHKTYKSHGHLFLSWPITIHNHKKYL
jgi:hypothetical protein